MQGIIITPSTPTHRDERGETWELFKGLPGLQVSLFHRRKGSKFAHHFHKGLDSSKDPELFFLIQGEVEVFARNGLTGEETKTNVASGTHISIAKNVYHEFRAITDATFLEYRSTVFNPDDMDCYPLDQYEDYISSLQSNE